MLLDIATEEIGHLEMVGLMVEALLRGAEREKAYEDTLFSMMGKGPQFMDSMGNAWTSNWIRASGDIVADLKHNISAEAGAKMAYDRLIRMTDDAGCKETLGYLMTRELAHQKMFMLALNSLDKKMEGEVEPKAGARHVLRPVARRRRRPWPGQRRARAVERGQWLELRGPARGEAERRGQGTEGVSTSWRAARRQPAGGFCLDTGGLTPRRSPIVLTNNSG